MWHEEVYVSELLGTVAPRHQAKGPRNLGELAGSRRTQSVKPAAMDFPCRVRDLFPVDLGVDLKAMQPEIIECKRRFQQDLWNTICNRVLQEQSSWKKGDEKDKGAGKEEKKGSKKGGGGGGGSSAASKETKSEEKAEESGGGGSAEGSKEEEKPEEEPPKEDEPPKEEDEPPKEEGEGEGENENNALPRGNRSNSSRRISNSNSSRLHRPQLQQQQLPQRFPTVTALKPQQQQQQQQQRRPRQHHQRQGLNKMQEASLFLINREQLPLPRRHCFGGELSNFLSRIQPLEGVLDWRNCSGGGTTNSTRPRVAAQINRTVLPPVLAQIPSTAATARSYSATSRREILGFEDVEDEDNEATSVASSEGQGQQDWQMLQSNSGVAEYASEADDSSTFYLKGSAAAAAIVNNEDGASQSTDGATREFVPLMVGNWWGQRGLQL